MPLLVSTIGIEIQKSIGGPDAPYIEDGLLHPYAGTSSTAVANVRQDKDGISYYTIQEGDTLSEVAELFTVTENTIIWENNIAKTVKVGQELRILPISGIRHTIGKGDTISKIAERYQVDQEDVSIYNGLSDGTLIVGKTIIVPNGVKPVEKKEEKKTSTYSKKSVSSNKTGTNSLISGGYYVRPTSGPVGSPFGNRVHPITGKVTFHYGIDYTTPTGTPVVAAADGKVARTSCGSGYGTCLIVQHNNGTQTLYAHLSIINFSTGEKVSQGEIIAVSGNTGQSTGPHLHFEIINSNGQKLNPAKYVN